MIHVFPAYFDTLTKVRLRWGLGIWDWITFGIALCIDLNIEYLSLPRVKGVAKLMEWVCAVLVISDSIADYKETLLP